MYLSLTLRTAEFCGTSSRDRVVLVQAMKVNRGSTGTAPLVLNLGTSELYSRGYLLNRRLSESPDRAVQFDVQKNLFLLLKTETPFLGRHCTDLAILGSRRKTRNAMILTF